MRRRLSSTALLVAVLACGIPASTAARETASPSALDRLAATEGIGSADGIGNSEGILGRESSDTFSEAPMNAERPPDTPPTTTPVPIDGGLSLLALAGGGYAVRRLRARRS